MTTFFNDDFYLARNPDVATAIAEGMFGTVSEHFEKFGKFENRAPNPFFDPTFYLEQNKDIAAFVAATGASAYDHFAQWGHTELRAPSAFFDPTFYLASNPDLQEAVAAGVFSAVEHFYTYGQNEPRAIHHSIDLAKYLKANPDVAAAVANGASALEHLVTHGITEGRDLGNGVHLDSFANDPNFQKAIESGNGIEALARVADVAPFMPTFEAPAGWKAPENLPIPTDFTPVEGEKLVIPEGVKVPEGTTLPDTFEPVEPTPPVEGGDGGTPTTPEPVHITLNSNSAKLTVNADDLIKNGKWADSFSFSSVEDNIVTSVDISGLKTADGKSHANGQLDLSQSDFGNNLTIKVSKLDTVAGNKSDLKVLDENGEPTKDAEGKTVYAETKSNQYIILPDLSEIQDSFTLTVENMTISSTAEYTHAANKNDVLDFSNLGITEKDFREALTGITVTDGDSVKVGDPLKYVNFKLDFDFNGSDVDGGEFTLNLNNIVSTNVYHKMLQALNYVEAETSVYNTTNDLVGKDLTFTNTKPTDFKDIDLINILIDEGTFVFGA